MIDSKAEMTTKNISSDLSTSQISIKYRKRVIIRIKPRIKSSVIG